MEITEIIYYLMLYVTGGFLSILFASLRDERVDDDFFLFIIYWPLMILFLLVLYITFWLIEKNEKLKQGK